jgi:hypothetical protein
MDNQNNLILNPHFAIWPYGLSQTSSTDQRMAACWLWNLGVGNVATVSKQTAPNSQRYVKWIRSQECLEIDVTSLADASAFKIYQKIYAQRFDLSRTLIRCTIFASGPVGESFYYGFDGDKKKIQMLGDNNESPPNPRLVSATSTFAVADLANQRIEFTAFEEPSSTGKFYIYMAFAAVNIGQNGDRINHRSDAEEWAEMDQYVTPIKKGMIGYGASSTQIRIPVQATSGGWIRNPQIPAGATLGTITLVDSQTAASVTHVGATYSIGTAPPQDTYGCSLIVGGLSGITAGRPYIIGDEAICVLETAYAS